MPRLGGLGLAARQFYLDVDFRVRPARAEAAAIVGGRARFFVDVAVMAPILPLCHDAMLVAGAPVADLLPLLLGCGMKAGKAGDDVGAAIAIKMVRSVMIKGLEALTQECFLAARAGGVEDRIIATLTQSFPALEDGGMAEGPRRGEHGIRRAAEMREVALTLEEMGVEPLMTRGTIERQQRAGDAKLKDAFGGKVPGDRAAIMQALSKAAGNGRV